MAHGMTALSSASALTYKVYSDLVEIDRISPEWERLLCLSPSFRAFGSAEWYRASCRSDTSLLPYLVVAFHGAEILGVLPLVLDQNAGLATFPSRLGDYWDMVIRGDNPDLAAGLLNHALAFSSSCKKILLSRVRPDSNCVKAIPVIASNPDIDCRYQKTDTYYYIDLPETFEDYLSSRSRSLRKRIRQARRDFDESQLVIRELLPSNYDPIQLPELFLSLVSARHKERCSLVRHAWVPLFMREVLPTIFSKGYMRLFAIFSGDRIIALHLYAVSTDAIGGWNGGFLDEAEHCSPGTLLVAHTIKQAIEMRLKEFDFMRGDEAYKSKWANNHRMVGEIELIAKG